MAPRAYDLVLRNVPARAAAHRLRHLRSRVPIPVQLVLRDRRTSTSSQRTRLGVATERRGGRVLPSARRRGHGEAHRLLRQRVARLCRARRARTPPRAATPRAAADGHQTRALVQSARTRLRRNISAGRAQLTADAVRRLRRRARRGRALGKQFRLRQRIAAAQGVPRTVPYRRPSRHRRRMDGVHRRRRLPPARTLALRRLARRARTRGGTRPRIGVTTTTTAGRASRSTAGVRSIPTSPSYM